MTYYGSADSTPLFVMLTAAHVRLNDADDILGQIIKREDGTETTVGTSMVAALDWITDHIAQSDLGLLEFQRMQPRGIRFQVLRLLCTVLDFPSVLLLANGL